MRAHGILPFQSLIKEQLSSLLPPAELTDPGLTDMYQPVQDFVLGSPGQVATLT